MASQNPVIRLKEQVETFLDYWVQAMADADYLKDTTAKREDCIQSFRGFLDPVFEYLESSDEIPPYHRMLQNEKEWAGNLIEFARRHRARGITVDMFQGCFKTLVHSLERMILEEEISDKEKLDAINMLRRWADGAEILMLADWKTMGQLEAVERLAETNRELTLEKNKYENILEATSDMVLVTDPKGMISEVNTEAKIVLKNRDLLGRYFGEVLGLGEESLETLLNRYPVNEHHEIQLEITSSVYNLRIIPLQSVSLASRGYMIVLADITLLVKQRESLMREVTERTNALADSEKQFTALFQNAGESILLVDEEFRIVESNRRSSLVFGLDHKQLVGVSFLDLCSDGNELKNLVRNVKNLKFGQNWEGELKGKRQNGHIFPMSTTINRIDLETGPIIQILVKDITNQKELEQNLQHEKNRLEELNITLRTVLRSINEKNTEYQKEIYQTIEEVLLPALERIGRESDAGVRDSYVNLVRDQLLKLTGDIDIECDAHLLKLSPTEMKICQFIQAGSATKDIAEALGLSAETIQTHRKNIRKKLGIRGRDVTLYNYLNAPDKTYPVESNLT